MKIIALIIFFLALFFILKLTLKSSNVEFVYVGKIYTTEKGESVVRYNESVSHEDEELIKSAEYTFKSVSPILFNMYGEQRIKEEYPLKLTLYDDSVWHIEGTLKSSKGGTVSASINKRTGQIIYITHYK
jgi:hypothetical protein